MKNRKENLEKLFRLIKENPDLPILPMVDSEIVAEDGYSRWTASWGSAEVGEYVIGNERVWIKGEDDEESVLEDFCVRDLYSMTFEQINEEYEKLPWIKAIIVNIDLPEE